LRFDIEQFSDLISGINITYLGKEVEHISGFYACLVSFKNLEFFQKAGKTYALATS
jgi:hypothetical protein